MDRRGCEGLFPFLVPPVVLFSLARRGRVSEGLMPKRRIKRLLKEELDLIELDYKLLTSFVTERAAHKYAQILWDDGWYAQVVDRVRKDWTEFRVYAKPEDESDWDDIPEPPEDDADALSRWKKAPPKPPVRPSLTRVKRRAPPGRD